MGRTLDGLCEAVNADQALATFGAQSRNMAPGLLVTTVW